MKNQRGVKKPPPRVRAEDRVNAIAEYLIYIIFNIYMYDPGRFRLAEERLMRI